jgi:hypothetical protein
VTLCGGGIVRCVFRMRKRLCILQKGSIWGFDLTVKEAESAVGMRDIASVAGGMKRRPMDKPVVASKEVRASPQREVHKKQMRGWGCEVSMDLTGGFKPEAYGGKVTVCLFVDAGGNFSYASAVVGTKDGK